MAFQTPITIKAALESIHNHRFALPAIQREFVWRPDQIVRLFDSVMRDYPIGAFLFWRVEPRRVKEYAWYEFVTDFHQRDSPHCGDFKVTNPELGLTAILDGQQRLTALNVGIYGSYASKRKGLWWNNPKAFPKTKLYLNLLESAPDGESGTEYDFRFLTDDQYGSQAKWFPVEKILDFDDLTDVYDYLAQQDLHSEKSAFKRLGKLHSTVHSDDVIAYYEEKDQDVDKVLQIFIRTNSGGTVLSYSDLLLSIATATWDEIDARSEIYELVDDLNGIGAGFSFNKDFVLKAGLMLADVADLGFKVTNFNRANMDRLEKQWALVQDTLVATVQLADSFGFSSATLSANNSLLPIAYYIHQSGSAEKILESPALRVDRVSIRQWLLRSLIKRGVWGSGLDGLLTRMRQVLRVHSKTGFPASQLSTAMAERGKGLAFTSEEIRDVTDTSYGEGRAYALLSLLFPFVDIANNVFHVDHIVPRGQVTGARLGRSGLQWDDQRYIKSCINFLPNLQLLTGHANKSKSAKFPAEWIRDAYACDAGRDEYAGNHLLGDWRELPANLHGFRAFYDARRDRVVQRLQELLGGEAWVVNEEPAGDA